MVIHVMVFFRRRFVKTFMVRIFPVRIEFNVCKNRLFDLIKYVFAHGTRTNCREHLLAYRYFDGNGIITIYVYYCVVRFRRRRIEKYNKIYRKRVLVGTHIESRRTGMSANRTRTFNRPFTRCPCPVLEFSFRNRKATSQRRCRLLSCAGSVECTLRRFF